jgi:ubiquitin-conjugating enzyme E2 I
MSNLAATRLAQERKNWRKDHPHGFVAKPDVDKKTGEANLMKWQCTIPGKQNTSWEGGEFPVSMEFSKDYPSKPPRVMLPKGFFHPNVYPTGLICLSILNEEKGWKPSISVKQILVGVQDLLDNPNNSDPANQEAYQTLKSSKVKYQERVIAEVRQYKAVGGDDDVIVM